MATIPKRVSDRISSELKRFQPVLQNARDRDVNEADTVTIVKDLLACVFGWDKYSEVTCEFSIRSTFCDLAIKLDGKVKFLIEVKAIGLPLKDTHLRQALDYGANHGIDWVILTNGAVWRIYKVLFERPIAAKHVCDIDMLEVNPKKVDEHEQLFLLCREGASKSAIEQFHEYRQIINRFVIASVVQCPSVLDAVRRELRQVSPESKTNNDEVLSILVNEVFKREVLEGDDAEKAKQLLKRAQNRATKKAADRSQGDMAAPASIISPELTAAEPTP